ncbi:MAG: hypothetical protein JW924_04770 [Fusobacteriaceae bacterium]|nr:hypothetical protein [Fusobacteriaceae bacterium]
MEKIERIENALMMAFGAAIGVFILIIVGAVIIGVIGLKIGKLISKDEKNGWVYKIFIGIIMILFIVLFKLKDSGLKEIVDRNNLLFIIFIIGSAIVGYIKYKKSKDSNEPVELEKIKVKYKLSNIVTLDRKQNNLFEKEVEDSKEIVQGVKRKKINWKKTSVIGIFIITILSCFFIDYFKVLKIALIMLIIWRIVFAFIDEVHGFFVGGNSLKECSKNSENGNKFSIVVRDLAIDISLYIIIYFYLYYFVRAFFSIFLHLYGLSLKKIFFN